MKASDYEHLYKGVSFKDGKMELRKLSDLTEEEVINLIYLRSSVYLNVKYTGKWSGGIDFEFEYKSSSRRRRECQKIDELSPKQFLYLLSISIDLFSLIPEGLAIDKTKQ